MNNATLTENKEEIIQKEKFSFSWKDSPAIQRLLDVISSILAEEYIAIVKQNPEIFQNITPRLSELRGCALSGQGGAK